MPTSLRSRLGAALVTVLVVVFTAGAAFAVSSGGYEPSEQDCSIWADNHDAGRERNVPPTEDGCHNFKLNVEDAEGHRFVQFGFLQEAPNENVHAGEASVDTNGDGTGTLGTATFDTNWQPLTPDSCDLFSLVFVAIGLVTGDGCSVTPQAPTAPPSVGFTPGDGSPDPTNGSSLLQAFHIYLGADDNLDTGEHDGVDGQYGSDESANGPSDGGAIVVNWHPLEVADWLAAVASGDIVTLLRNPMPLADAGFGSCADGICLSVQSRQRTVYEGGTAGERNVYDYDGKKWDPADCSSGSDKDEQECGHEFGGAYQNLNEYREHESSRVNAEPGVQFYEDPDAQGSPIGPYPLPAAYVGTCGVELGGGDADFTGAPSTNSAGQLEVEPGDNHC